MYQELMLEAIKDRQARVRADVYVLNHHPAASHPVRRKVGMLMVRLGRRLQAVGGDELTLEPAGGAA